MKRIYALVLSCITAWWLATLFEHHEGPLACPVKVCGPDQLPMLVWLALWAAIYLVARRITK